jgi:hypothetical protein
LIAHFINRAQVSEKREWTESPWALVDAIFEDPGLLPGGLGKAIGKTFRDKWKKLPKDRRALLELVARGALSDAQALRAFQPTEREKAKIVATDKELLTNPYQLYELDRTQGDPISFPVVDRAMFPDPVVREAFPLPEPSLVEEAIDARRVRAAAVHILEQAREEGHTLLPRGWVIQRVRDASLSPACPLDEDTLAVTEGSFAPPPSLDRDPRQREGLSARRARVGGGAHSRRHPQAGAPRPGTCSARTGAGSWTRRSMTNRCPPTRTSVAPRSERAPRRPPRWRRSPALARPCSLALLGRGKSTLLRALCAIPRRARWGRPPAGPDRQSAGAARDRDPPPRRGAHARSVLECLGPLRREDGPIPDRRQGEARAGRVYRDRRRVFDAHGGAARRSGGCSRRCRAPHPRGRSSPASAYRERSSLRRPGLASHARGPRRTLPQGRTELCGTDRLASPAGQRAPRRCDARALVQRPSARSWRRRDLGPREQPVNEVAAPRSLGDGY